MGEWPNSKSTSAHRYRNQTNAIYMALDKRYPQ